MVLHSSDIRVQMDLETRMATSGMLCASALLLPGHTADARVKGNCGTQLTGHLMSAYLLFGSCRHEASLRLVSTCGATMGRPIDQ